MPNKKKNKKTFMSVVLGILLILTAVYFCFPEVRRIIDKTTEKVAINWRLNK